MPETNNRLNTCGFLIETFRNDRQEDTLTLTLSLQGRGEKNVKLSRRGLLFLSCLSAFIRHPDILALK